MNNINNFTFPSSAPYSEFCHHATTIVREAGEIIYQAFYNPSYPPNPNNKDNNTIDLVTVTDQAVESIIKRQLLQFYPSFQFIGEESVAGGASCQLTHEPTIICDPIDGTTNFVHGFPFVCISIGLVVNYIPTVGIIFNPILNEMYLAHRGYGAYLNGKPLPYHRNSLPLSIHSTLVISEGGHDRRPDIIASKLNTWNNFLAHNHANLRGIRCTGSGALNLCMIARGSADVYWEIGLHAWDMAAGIVIVQEAGGLVVGQEFLALPSSDRINWSQETIPFDILGRKCLALRKSDHDFLHEFVKLLHDYPCDRD